MIYFTSDLHLGHNKEFLYGPRGFSSIEEHNKAVVEHWRNTIRDDDTVYVLGDLVVGDMEQGFACLQQLNGNIKVIRGNHDTNMKVARYSEFSNIEVIGWADMIEIDHIKFYLSHFPASIKEFVKSPYLKNRWISLHGHTHDPNAFSEGKTLTYNVCCDAHDCTPVSIDDIVSDIKNKIRMEKQQVMESTAFNV